MCIRDSLKTAHEKNIVHCDIKGDNFLLDKDYNLCLIDGELSQDLKQDENGNKYADKAISG